jgi:hypothetical protein
VPSMYVPATFPLGAYGNTFNTFGEGLPMYAAYPVPYGQEGEEEEECVLSFTCILQVLEPTRHPT